MKNDTEVAKVKCPFFVASRKRNILCEGITDDSKINLQFDTEEATDKQRRIFCNTKYENCEIYRTLEGKYEE